MHLHHSTADLINNQLVLFNSETPGRGLFFYSLKFNDGGGGGGTDPTPPEVARFDPPIKDVQIWGSCNGLLCLTDYMDDDKVCLWNPLTKEYKDLPPPLLLTEIPIGITKVRHYYGVGSITYGFGYDRFIDDYKVIRCEHFIGHLDGDEKNYDDHISIIEFQVYTLGTNTWRKISPDNNPYKSYFVQDPHTGKPTPFVNGALHWIMSASNSLQWTATIIVSFDIEKEVFREIQRPFSELDRYDDLNDIQALRGYLCALKCVCDFDDVKESYCNVWMMMDYGVKESWSKLFTIVQKEVESSYESSFLYYRYRLLRFFENGEMLIKISDILFIYDPINNKARRVEFGEIDKYLYESVIYMESLVSLNSGVYEGQREFQDEDDDDKGSELFRDRLVK